VAKAEVLQVQLQGPAFREPAVFEVAWAANRVSLKVSRPAKVRLSYRVLRPGWPAKDRPVLRRRRPGGRAEGGRREVVWKDNYVEGQDAPGEYELQARGR